MGKTTTIDMSAFSEDARKRDDLQMLAEIENIRKNRNEGSCGIIAYRKDCDSQVCCTITGTPNAQLNTLIDMIISVVESNSDIESPEVIYRKITMEFIKQFTRCRL